MLAAQVLAVAALTLVGGCDGILGIPGGDFTFTPGNPDGGDGTPDSGGSAPDGATAPTPDSGTTPPDADTGPPALAPAAYVKASNPGGGDSFGWQVALWGDTLAVSALREDSVSSGVGGDQSNDDLPRSGAVYVFRRTGGEWAQEAYLKASRPGDSDEFGYALALWGDTLAVSAWGERSNATGVGGDDSDDSLVDAGAVYVFRRTGSEWAQEAYIKASNTGAGDEFGVGLALWEDTLAVGAPEEDSDATGVGGEDDNDGAQDSGAVYVFRRTGTDWAQEAYIKASNAEPFDEFGVNVALYQDTLAVGAFLEDGGVPGVGGDESDRSAIDSGAVYVFRRVGAIWSQEAYVKASNPSANDFFGRQVALWDDTLAVGAPQEGSAATDVNGEQMNEGAPASGAAYVFRHDGSEWAQEAYLKASNTGSEDLFGTAVAVVDDLLAVGAPREDSRPIPVPGGGPDDDGASESGAAYLFERSAGTWAPRTFVKPVPIAAGDELGTSVALSADTLVVGAPLEDSAATGVTTVPPDDDGAPDSGAALIFLN
ncbi:FG-GAP repeat protein [Haliangium sp.]|uniref:FG-GAP repeat protein n=1 Tax=Haliangium sp. TaxID=2663208 RepID=UPI003D0B27AA